MDSSEETAAAETTGRRTRSGRFSKPVASKPAARKTRKKMVLVEVEVSDEEENDLSQQQAAVDRTAAVSEEAAFRIELRTDCDDNQTKAINKTKSNKTVHVDERRELENYGPFNKDLLKSYNDPGIKLSDEAPIEIVENDITIETSFSESVDEEANLEETEAESNDHSEANADLQFEINSITLPGELELLEGNKERDTPELSPSLTNEADENGFIEDINDIIHGVANNVHDSKISDSSESQSKDNSSDLNDKSIEFSESMEVDDDNLLSHDNRSETDKDEEDLTDLLVEMDNNKDVNMKDRADLLEEMDEDPMDDATRVVSSDQEVDEESESVGVQDESESVSSETEEKEDELDQMQECKYDEDDQDETVDNKQIMPADPDAENISEDELPTVQVAKVPETEEVSDEELPGPKRAELPADTEVVSEDELPAVKKEGTKRKIAEGDYDPGSPTSENEVSPKKPFLELEAEKEKDKTDKPKKLPELDKYWKAVNDDPTDFTGWTYLLQYVDQENDMEAAREAYDAFLSHYPYCYGYWRKYADYEKRKGNKKKCEEVFERGLKAIPLSVDLWIHYLTYVRTSKPDEEDFVRSQFERALSACGLEFRSDRLWDSYIKWETDAKRLQHVTVIYDRLLTTPTQGYTTHFDNFQEHVTSNPPNKILEVDEFLALRKEVKHMLKHDVTTEPAENPDVPPGEDSEEISSDEETKTIRERIVSIRRKIHKNTVTAVTGRWNFEEGIKRPYFHVKPLERCQLKNWQEYLDYEITQGDQTRIIVLFERCLIACALYEEFWLRFVQFLEGLQDTELHCKIKDVYERACTIHHIKKPNLHLQWAMFEESIKNFTKAAEILVNLEKSVPNILQVAYRRINLERRRDDYEKCAQLYEHYIVNAKNKMISTNLSIKYSRFSLKVMKNPEKAVEILNQALAKDCNNARLHLQLIDLSLQKDDIVEDEIVGYIDAFLEKENLDIDQKVLFAQRKLEFLEDFGSDIHVVQKAYEDYQKFVKTSKETKKKEPVKGDATVGKKEKNPPLPSSQANSYANYGNYGNSSGAASAYQYSGSQQGQYNYSQYGQNEQYQYGNWQYPQSGYSGYNQWSGYSGGYGY